MTLRLRCRASHAAALVAAASLMFVAGCGVQRTLVVDSEPPGALVYLNHEEVGRTPLRYDFTWYGEYDVQLRKEGFQTINSTEWVVAPWWQWPPFDFLAEFTPGRPTDTHSLAYVMRPATRPADPEAMVRRAESLRGELRTGQYNREPATQTTTRPGPTTRTTSGVRG